ncbi:uncharacterized protein Dyak_GE27819 [Drosophila yakuba]|uniref:K Homology domain-containing protein n=1 Tax=Drosophila yakuba TaxID=7245 RepID=A0A0R1E8K0_DROYA|nr:uncharacterized protein Dyak_GE27819 [Drosophila yakuba]
MPGTYCDCVWVQLMQSFRHLRSLQRKFEEWCSQFNDVGKVGKTQIPIRLIVPASQCGSLIGKSGSKIKEIRQTTGCSIQVASEMLPNSTERAVTLSGSAEQITQCIYQICLVMLESPPRGATIPYRPKPQVTGPVILANGQAFTIQGNYAVPTQEVCRWTSGRIRTQKTRLYVLLRSVKQCSQTSQSTVPITVKDTDSKTNTEPITAPNRRTHEVHIFSSPSGDPEQ